MRKAPPYRQDRAGTGVLLMHGTGRDVCRQKVLFQQNKRLIRLQGKRFVRGDEISFVV